MKTSWVPAGVVALAALLLGSGYKEVPPPEKVVLPKPMSPSESLAAIKVADGLEVELVAAEPLQIAALVFGTMVLKLAVMRLLGKLFGLDRPSRWLFAFSLAQIGEFAFVLLQLGMKEGVWDNAFAGPLFVAVAISMVLTPLLFIVLERWVLPAVSERDVERKQDEIHDADAPVVIAARRRTVSSE